MTRSVRLVEPQYGRELTVDTVKQMLDSALDAGAPADAMVTFARSERDRPSAEVTWSVPVVHPDDEAPS